jgi:hypothetical protein
MSKEEKKHTLRNIDISNQYRDIEMYLMLSDFQGALAYWITKQNPNNTFIVDRPLEAWTKYLQQKYFRKEDEVVMFTYDKLSNLIDEDIFIAIPEIMELNEMKPDFIDLGALARNMFYTICREQITQPL